MLEYLKIKSNNYAKILPLGVRLKLIGSYLTHFLDPQGLTLLSTAWQSVGNSMSILFHVVLGWSPLFHISYQIDQLFLLS